MKGARTAHAIATWGSIGKLPGGALVAAGVSLAVWFLIHLLFNIGFVYSWGALCIIISLALCIIQWSRSTDQDRQDRVIVLDNVVGVLVAVCSVPVKIKLYLFAYLLFFLLLFTRSFVEFKRFFAWLNKLPGALGTMADDITVGVIINIFIHFVVWIVQ